MTIAVLYEHPQWFTPLFAALERRGLSYVRLHAESLTWDPSVPPSYALLINRMSPSAYLRGHNHAIVPALHYLTYAETWGIPIVNGPAAYRLELSKAFQLSILERLGIRHPRARVVNRRELLTSAAEELRFPVLVKPNVGGSGARIQRFDSESMLARGVESGAIELGVDDTALVQELLPARGGSITRIELLDREYLYAIRIQPPAGLFNLCPADICQTGPGELSPAAADSQDLSFCPTRPAMAIESADPPAEVLRHAEAIAKAGHLDVCGIEYLIDDRDGEAYIYDINALSNFVSDAPRIIGFDPFESFVDYVERRLAGVPAPVRVAP